MAEKKAEENQEEAAQGGSKKKLIIIIAIVVLISIGASIGVTLFFLGGSSGGTSDEPAEPTEPVKKPALYYDFKPAFIVAMNVGGKQRYMQIHLAAMGREQAAFDTLEMHMPLVRNKLIALYGAQDFEKLQTKEGKEFLQEESKRIINEILQQEGDGLEVEKTLFSNFVMQ